MTDDLQPRDPGHCPHCGRGDAGPSPEAYEEMRQRAEKAGARSEKSYRHAATFQTRLGDAREWARRNLPADQAERLYAVLRGDLPTRDGGGELDPPEEMSMPDASPTVQGRCPACRGESLMLAGGGYVTCRRLACLDPEAATRALELPKETPDA
ncbi:hypothetical protein [Streptomyces sp. NPDC127040]|uniref:hypothetical protein n=1 Tax=Streptomyces sp. NPDC127040 TaxID=3347116 RepID=UPI0036628C52